MPFFHTAGKTLILSVTFQVADVCLQVAAEPIFLQLQVQGSTGAGDLAAATAAVLTLETQNVDFSRLC